MGCTGIQPVDFLGWLASTWAFTEWSPEQGATCSDPGPFLKTLQDFSWLMLSHCPHTCPALHPSYTLPFLNLTFLFFHISYLWYLSLGCSFCPTDPLILQILSQMTTPSWSDLTCLFAVTASSFPEPPFSFRRTVHWDPALEVTVFGLGPRPFHITEASGGCSCHSWPRASHTWSSVEFNWTSLTLGQHLLPVSGFLARLSWYLRISLLPLSAVCLESVAVLLKSHPQDAFETQETSGTSAAACSSAPPS